MNNLAKKHNLRRSNSDDFENKTDITQNTSKSITSIACSLCLIKSLCKTTSQDSRSIEQSKLLDSSNLKINNSNLKINTKQVVHKDKHIYKQGNLFTNIYILKSGMFKTYYLTENGEIQITGFLMPGDVFGLDGLSNNTYQTSAIALDTSSVCKVSRTDFLEATQKSSELFNQLLKSLSNEVCEDKKMFFTLGKGTTQSRLCGFILRQTARCKNLQLSENYMSLSMTRLDISNYLGMASETVSREFSRLQKLGVIKVTKKEIAIINLTKLNELALLA